MGSMSYCTFENGEANIRQGLDMIEEEGLEEWLKETSQYEVDAVLRLFEDLEWLHRLTCGPEAFEAAAEAARVDYDDE